MVLVENTLKLMQEVLFFLHQKKPLKTANILFFKMGKRFSNMLFQEWLM